MSGGLERPRSNESQPEWLLTWVGGEGRDDVKQEVRRVFAGTARDDDRCKMFQTPAAAGRSGHADSGEAVR